MNFFFSLPSVARLHCPWPQCTAHFLGGAPRLDCFFMLRCTAFARSAWRGVLVVHYPCTTALHCFRSQCMAWCPGYVLPFYIVLHCLRPQCTTGVLVPVHYMLVVCCTAHGRSAYHSFLAVTCPCTTFFYYIALAPTRRCTASITYYCDPNTYGSYIFFFFNFFFSLFEFSGNGDFVGCYGRGFYFEHCRYSTLYYYKMPVPIICCFDVLHCTKSTCCSTNVETEYVHLLVVHS